MPHALHGLCAPSERIMGRSHVRSDGLANNKI